MIPPRVRLGRLVGAAIVTAVALLVAPVPRTPAQSSIFFVTPEGSDVTGDGSAGRPWATIGHAAAVVPDAPNTLVVVAEGTYAGPVRIPRAFGSPIGFRAEKPYYVRLVADGETVLDVTGARNVTLAGFEVTRGGAGPAGAPLVRIGGAGSPTLEIQLRDMVIHDGRSDDLVRVGPEARQVLVESSVLYNPGRGGSHLRVTGAEGLQVAGNIFFNAFAADQPERTSAGSFLVLSRAGAGAAASRDVSVDRNIFLDWQGIAGGHFVTVGGGAGFPAAEQVLIESNLFAGNSPQPMAAPLGLDGARSLTFRANTVAGDLPAAAYAVQLQRAAGAPANQDVRYFNNVWSDPTGTMADFSDGARSTVTGLQTQNNLYWNGGAPIPEDGEALSVRADAAAVIGDPLLPDQAGLVPPVWDRQSKLFGGRYRTQRAAFEALAETARTAGDSPAIDRAMGEQAPLIDLLGRPRGVPDIGALEQQPLTDATPTPRPAGRRLYLPVARRGVR
jgi:hypothetical protein